MIQRGSSATSETATMGSDVFAWLLNVSTSVMIVFVNKLLMDPNWGYRFSFATTLCALHFLACAASVWTAEELGFGKKVRLPLKDTIGFALIASVSIATLNLSLLVNSVGFYQISKLLIIPFVCSVEYIWLSRRFTPEVLMSIMVVVTGVGIVTVTDVAMSPLGLTIAAISVVTSGLQQILCGTMQRKYSVTPNQLLSNTAPLQGVMLLLIGPYVDKLLTDKWILAFDVNLPALNCLALSCAVAVLVNISQFMCLGKFSAVTFQVLGHTKTVLVLVLGWLYLGDVIGPRKFLGMAMAVVGMMGYGYLSAQKQISAPQGPGTKPTPVLRFSAHSTALGLHSTAADVRGGGRSKDKERSDDDDSELSSLESGEGRGVPLLARGH